MPAPAPQNEVIEIIKISLGLVGVLIGGFIVLLGGWLTDRRKLRNEQDSADQRERAMFTGIFAIRNYIMQTLNDYEKEGLASQLEPLRTAQAYVHRLIDKAPSDSERLMIVVIEIGLNIDTIAATLDRREAGLPLSNQQKIAEMLHRDIERLVASLEQFDLIAHGQLSMMDEDELMQFPGYAEAMAVEEANSKSPTNTP
jgi:hypothetical protein